jgi:uncharacterized protein involved in outer membrane biogenesis
MKKVILTVATVLTMGLVGHSQCDVKVKTNEYTQEKKIETGFIKFRSGVFRIDKKDSVVSMYLSLNTNISLDIEQGEILYFKLANGNIVKIINNRSSYGDYSRYTGYYNSFYFNLDNEILKAFQESPIIGIKCYINEYDMQSSVGRQLQDNFKCITEFN